MDLLKDTELDIYLKNKQLISELIVIDAVSNVIGNIVLLIIMGGLKQFVF